MFKKNSISDLSSIILGAVLPFLTIGMLGNKIILYISAAVGILALTLFVYGFFRKYQLQVENILHKVIEILGLPYGIALSAAILDQNGIDASIGYWFSLLVIILAISSVANTIFDRSKKGS